MTTANMVIQEERGKRRTAREKRRGESIIEGGAQVAVEVEVEVEATADIPRTKNHCLPMGDPRSERGIREIGSYGA